MLQVAAALPAGFRVPVCFLLHAGADEQRRLVACFATAARVPAVQAEDKMRLEPGRIHVAPGDYHLLVERSGTLALSVGPAVCFCRPSIDVLFGSAARAWGRGGLAILLSGANEDGAAGLAEVRAAGGTTVAQAPATAQFPLMPQAAVDAGAARLILSPSEIVALVQQAG